MADSTNLQIIPEKLNPDKHQCCFKYKRPLPHISLGETCQFSDESEFFEVDNYKYCRFHMPLIDRAGCTTMKLTWDEAHKKLFAQGISDVLNRAMDFKDKTIFLDRRLTADLSGVEFPIVFDFPKWAKDRYFRDNQKLKKSQEGYPLPRLCAARTTFPPRNRISGYCL